MTQKFRKPNRLSYYDYGQRGTYFLTICTHNHENCFWTDTQSFCLSKAGEIVDAAIRQIPNHYSGVKLDHYVVMPNHVHILLTLSEENSKRDVSTIIGHMKRWATIRIGKPLWQKGFHDHVIRCEQDYITKWEYIDTNPLRWKQDEFYYDE